MSTKLTILFQDSHLVAIHKPSGLLVHRSRIAAGETRSAMTELRDQLGQWVYPVHRLDRSASGVLIFGLSSESASGLARQFREHAVRKTYLAAVRGWPEEEGTVDKPLRSSLQYKQGDTEADLAPAVSHYRVLCKAEIPVATGRYATSRIALVRVSTDTGRRHQVRKHLSSISHPILGDTVYGDGRYNRLLRERFGAHRLMLLGESIEFAHPTTGERMRIEAQPEEEFEGVCGGGGSLPGAAT